MRDTPTSASLAQRRFRPGAAAAAALLGLCAVLAACSGLPSEESDIPPTTQIRRAVIIDALRQLGADYQRDAAGPRAYDDSGLTQYAYQKSGASLARNIAAQLDTGKPVTLEQARPADLLFYRIDSGANKPRLTVGLLMRPGQMIIALPGKAGSTDAGVRRVSITPDYWRERLVGVIQILPIRDTTVAQDM